MKGFFVIMLALLITSGGATAQDSETISLPKPVLANDKPTMQAMADRKSGREFAETELSLQDLANVLWCANGVNRPESGRRTAPSAMNKQDIDVYVVLKSGVYFYDAAKHELVMIDSVDFRRYAGTQEYVATAPLNIILVSNLAKFDFNGTREDKMVMGALDAGHCSQNVYLYSAAANLVCVTRASIDKHRLGGILKLSGDQVIMLGLTVGYPKAAESK